MLSFTRVAQDGETQSLRQGEGKEEHRKEGRQVKASLHAQRKKHGASGRRMGCDEQVGGVVHAVDMSVALGTGSEVRRRDQ